MDAGGRGILIRGPSGSGKTSLALALIEALGEPAGAMLVADDQVCLRRDGELLLASPPASLEGLAELYGYGVIRIPWKAQTGIVLCADLIAPEMIERMPEDSRVTLCGVTVDHLLVPARHEAHAVRILRAWLDGRQAL